MCAGAHGTTGLGAAERTGALEEVDSRSGHASANSAHGFDGGYRNGEFRRAQLDGFYR